jgi:hypothetical protein
MTMTTTKSLLRVAIGENRCVSEPAAECLSPAQPQPRTPNPGLAFLVCLAWYAAIVVGFLSYANRLPDVTPDDCTGFCVSDRGGMLMFGLFMGAPSLFVALLVSLVVLGLVIARTRMRSAAVVGSLAASPALVVALWFVCAELGRPWPLF